MEGSDWGQDWVEEAEAGSSLGPSKQVEENAEARRDPEGNSTRGGRLERRDESKKEGGFQTQQSTGLLHLDHAGLGNYTRRGGIGAVTGKCRSQRGMGGLGWGVCARGNTWHRRRRGQVDR